MSKYKTVCRTLLLPSLFVVCTSNVVSQGPEKSKAVNRQAKSSPSQIAEMQDASARRCKQDDQVQLKFIDGTCIPVDDARENEQGIWYKQNGVAYLAPRERVKTIERSQNAKAKVEPEGAALALANPAEKLSASQPVWIYLIGGARVEADSATESSAGVWYRRGSLTGLIERSRVERIVREDLESAAKSDSSTKERGWTTGRVKIDSLIKQNGSRYGVDPYLIFCVMEQESHFSTRAVSPRGARGLMQLMPGTGARFGVRHPFNPAESISGGARYLKQLLDRFSGRVDLVLASYNAGEGNVIKYGHKVPPYRETRNYVRRISYRYHSKAPGGRSSAPAGPGALGN